MFMSKWYFHPYDAAKVKNIFQYTKHFGKKNENMVFNTTRTNRLRPQAQTCCLAAQDG